VQKHIIDHVKLYYRFSVHPRIPYLGPQHLFEAHKIYFFDINCRWWTQNLEDFTRRDLEWSISWRQFS